MPEKSFAELKRIAANQAETIKRENEIIANQQKELQLRQQKLEMERVQYQQAKNADIHHQVNQCVDFAIRSLPWWKLSTKNVIKLANEYFFAIRHEVAKHVALDMLANKTVEESLEEKPTDIDAETIE